MQNSDIKIDQERGDTIEQEALSNSLGVVTTEDELSSYVFAGNSLSRTPINSDADGSPSKLSAKALGKSPISIAHQVDTAGVALNDFLSSPAGKQAIQESLAELLHKQLKNFEGPFLQGLGTAESKTRSSRAYVHFADATSFSSVTTLVNDARHNAADETPSGKGSRAAFPSLKKSIPTSVASSNSYEDDPFDSRTKNHPELTKALVKRVANISIEEGRRKPIVATNFIASVYKVKKLVIYTDESVNMLIQSKLSQDIGTTAWLNSMAQMGTEPYTLEEWKHAIFKECDVGGMQATFRLKVRNARQGSMGYLDYYSHFRSLMGNGGLEDSARMAETFVDSLAAKERNLLTFNHEYDRLESSGQLNVARVHPIMVKLLDKLASAPPVVPSAVKPAHIPSRTIKEIKQEHVVEKISRELLDKVISDLGSSGRHRLIVQRRCLYCKQRGCVANNHAKASDQTC